jgi:cell wall-associated NlpC family hydrolase
MLFTAAVRLVRQSRSHRQINESPSAILPATRPSVFVMASVLAFAAHASPHPYSVDEMRNGLAMDGAFSAHRQERQTEGEGAAGPVAAAMSFIGVPYRWGGTSAETGFDCSGLVLAVYDKTIGPVLPRTAAQQAAATRKIDRSDIAPGDLVFFNTRRHKFSHVGIYVGEGKFIHAPRTGARVRIDDMHRKYWTRRFTGARRVPEAQVARHVPRQETPAAPNEV